MQCLTNESPAEQLITDYSCADTDSHLTGSNTVNTRVDLKARKAKAAKHVTIFGVATAAEVLHRAVIHFMALCKHMHCAAANIYSIRFSCMINH
jgi:hypothetical protein